MEPWDDSSDGGKPYPEQGGQGLDGSGGICADLSPSTDKVPARINIIMSNEREKALLLDKETVAAAGHTTNNEINLYKGKLEGHSSEYEEFVDKCPTGLKEGQRCAMRTIVPVNKSMLLLMESYSDGETSSHATLKEGGQGLDGSGGICADLSPSTDKVPARINIIMSNEREKALLLNKETVAATGHTTNNEEGGQELGGSGGISTETFPSTEKIIMLPSETVGSLSCEGLKLLGLRPDSWTFNTDLVHCFTMSEFTHILSMPGPCSVKFSGLESLDKAVDVEIVMKEKARKNWMFPDRTTVAKLVTLYDEICGLYTKWLPRINFNKKGELRIRKGNTKTIAAIVKKSKSVHKLSVKLSKKKVQGVIGKKFFKLISASSPEYLCENLTDIISMAKEVPSKCVWFR